MVRPFKREDYEIFIEMSEAFYQTDAVEFSPPRRHFEQSFENVLSGNPFQRGYIIETETGEPAGYGLTFVSYLNELGGLMYTLDEIYIKPEFRGLGLGTDYIGAIEKLNRDTAAVFRLESEDNNAGAIKLYTRLGYKRVRYRQAIKFMKEAEIRPYDQSLLRPMTEADEADFIALAKEHQTSGIRENAASDNELKKTFSLIMTGSPYVQGYMLMLDGRTAGYALICPTYSNEAGGSLPILDEIYVIEECRGKGLASNFIRFFESIHKDAAVNRIQVIEGDERHISYVEREGYEYLEYIEMFKKAEVCP